MFVRLHFCTCMIMKFYPYVYKPYLSYEIEEKLKYFIEENRL
jgi:hypothetical protein